MKYLRQDLWIVWKNTFKACAHLRYLTRSHNHTQSIEIKSQVDCTDRLKSASTTTFLKVFFRLWKIWNSLRPIGEILKIEPSEFCKKFCADCVHLPVRHIFLKVFFFRLWKIQSSLRSTDFAKKLTKIFCKINEMKRTSNFLETRRNPLKNGSYWQTIRSQHSLRACSLRSAGAQSDRVGVSYHN